MTWIVAGRGDIYPFMVADIRVTFEQVSGGSIQRHCVDCLQKVHDATPNILYGFSGSVGIGLRILDRLRAETSPDHKYDLELISNTWLPRVMRHTFEACSSPEERRAGCSILMLGAHPTKDNGLPGYPRIDLFKYHAPNFSPLQAGGGELFAIGAADTAEHMLAAANEVSADPAFFQLSMAGAWAPAEFLAGKLQECIRKKRVQGVSDHWIYGSVTNEGPLIQARSVKIWKPDGTTVIDAPPQFARTSQEFEDLCRAGGLAAASAVG